MARTTPHAKQASPAKAVTISLILTTRIHPEHSPDPVQRTSAGIRGEVGTAETGGLVTFPCIDAIASETALADCEDPYLSWNQQIRQWTVSLVQCLKSQVWARRRWAA